MTTFGALARSARRWPHRAALVFPDERVSYRDLLDEASEFAAGLLTVGVSPGDRVALLAENSVAWAALFYAAGRVGAVVVPINPRCTAAEAEYFLTQSGASVVLAGPGAEHLGELLATGRTVFWAVEEGHPEFAAPLTALTGKGPRVLPAVSADDIALIQYTSGSTSVPKGVRLRHLSVTGDAHHVARRLSLQDGTIIFSGAPFFHVGGTVLNLLLSHVKGATAVALPRYTVTAALELIERERCTLMTGVEPHFVLLMESSEFSAERVPSLRQVISTGTPDTLRRIGREMHVPEVVALYGLSETSSNITMCAATDPETWRVDSCGYPHLGAEIAILDPDSERRLGTGEVGEIAARGYNVMAGYHGLPEETARAFTSDGWLRTGDLGYRDEDGLLYFCGRLKDMLRVGGENVAAAEVEAVLAALDEVAQAAVVGRWHPRLGEVPVAFVRLHDSVDGAEFPDAVAPVLAKQLSSFKCPREVIVVAEMPMTGSGKIHKPTLKGWL